MELTLSAAPLHALGWLAFAGGFCLSGLLVLLETALDTTVQVPSLSLETKKLREEPRVRKLLERAEQALISCEIARYFFLALTVVSGTLLLRGIVPPGPHAVNFYAAAALALCVLVVLFAEIFPRSLAVEHPEAIVRATAGVYLLLNRLTSGTRHVIQYLARHTVGGGLHAVGAQGEIPAEGMNRGAAESEPGVIEADEYELIDGILEFHESTVADILTHRSEIVSYPLEMDRAELGRKMRAGRFSRVPIYETTSDHPLGILHLKDLLLFPEREIRELLRKPLIVAENLGLFELLREFKRNKVHIALIYDQYHALLGLVTMHDLLEEIIGKMRDEEGHEAQALYSRGVDGRLLVAGRISLDQLKEELNVELPGEDVRTLSGYVMHRLERIPVAGDEVEAGDWKIVVREMSGRTLAQAEMSPLSAEPLESETVEGRRRDDA